MQYTESIKNTTELIAQRHGKPARPVLVPSARAPCCQASSQRTWSSAGLAVHLTATVDQVALWSADVRRAHESSCWAICGDSCRATEVVEAWTLSSASSSVPSLHLEWDRCCQRRLEAVDLVAPEQRWMMWVGVDETDRLLTWPPGCVSHTDVLLQRCRSFPMPGTVKKPSPLRIYTVYIAPKDAYAALSALCVTDRAGVQSRPHPNPHTRTLACSHTC